MKAKLLLITNVLFTLLLAACNNAATTVLATDTSTPASPATHTPTAIKTPSPAKTTSNLTSVEPTQLTATRPIEISTATMEATATKVKKSVDILTPSPTPTETSTPISMPTATTQPAEIPEPVEPSASPVLPEAQPPQAAELTPSPSWTPTAIPTPACENWSASMTISSAPASPKVGDAVTVTVTLINTSQACPDPGFPVLVSPLYQLSIQSDSSEQVFDPSNPSPIEHYSGGAGPGGSDSVEFVLQAVGAGRVTLIGSASFEVHLGYPGPSFFLGSGTGPHVITVEGPTATQTPDLSPSPSWTPTRTITPTSTPLVCENWSASMTISATPASPKVGDVVTVTVTLINTSQDCPNFRLPLLGMPLYRLSIQSDSPEQIFDPSNPSPITHYLGLAPGESDSVEFVLQAVGAGRVTLNSSASFEVHLGYPGPAFWWGSGTGPFLITVRPVDSQPVEKK